jgi:hypothetical protein
MRTHIILFFLTLVSAARGQRISFGVITGTSLTSDFPGRDYTTPADSFGNPASHFQFLTGPRSLTLGAAVEGRLSDSFSIEADALHRPMKSTIVYTTFHVGAPVNVSTNHFTGVEAWEFPVLFKYSLPSALSKGRLHPFLAAGPSFRTQENAQASEPSHFGVSAAFGASLRLGRIRIAPELRYTRWQQESISPRFPTKPDQLEFLTTIAYETNADSRHVAGRKLELGALIGAPVTLGFHGFDYSGTIPERASYLAGVTAQMNVVRGLAVEADGIYKPLRAGGFSVLTWQVPILAKYRLTRPRWTPFAEAGPSFRLAGNLNGYNPSHAGVTAGGGIERRAGRLLLAPTVRYTRWARDAPLYKLPSGIHYNYPRTNPNAVELVFGVSF